MKRRLALRLIAAAPALARAQTPSAADLGADIEILRECVTTLHPGLLRYNTPAQIEASLATLQNSFTTAPDLAQRFLALSRFLTTLKCGHSYANFYNQSPAVQAALFDKKARLPFTFRWVNEQMVVTGHAPGHAPSPAQLPRGAVVTAINGRPTAGLLHELMACARADGHNDAKRRSLLAVRAHTKYETFDVFHGLLAGAPAGGRFNLSVQFEGQVSALEVPALTMAERHAQIPAAAQTPNAVVWDWRVDETQKTKGVAVLTMPGWALYNSRWDWKAWLNDKLDSLASDRQLKGLVVDLRGNEGGLDCGDLILARFLKNDSVLPMQRLVRFVQTPERLNPYLDTWDKSFQRLGANAQRVDDRFLALPASDSTARPQGQAIDKPLVVLTDASNSSATYLFAQRVKAARVGQLVGETTGGNQRGINGGAFFFVRLPASGLEFDLPLIGTFAPAPAPDAGVEPDVAVAVTAADIAAGRDTPMQRALAAI
jgi:Peptidase family S41